MAFATKSPRYTVNQPALTVDEQLSSLFQPDTLLSAQYSRNLRRRTILEPEKRLMLAVLEDAVNCLRTNVVARTKQQRRLFRETEDWILEPGHDWVFSFENICAILGFDPQYVRQGLLRLKEKRLPKHRRGSDPLRGVRAFKNLLGNQ
jgi:hypothetical protein